MSNQNKILKPLFYLTTVYSFFALTPLAEKTGGACNAGIVLIGIGFFLVICAVLTFFAIKNITGIEQTNSRNGVAKVLSILALLIWGFWAVTFVYDELAFTLLYFTPFLITIFTTIIVAFTNNRRLIKLQDQETNSQQ